MFNKIKDKAKNVQANVSEKVGVLQGKAAEELQKLAAGVDSLQPVLEALGYEVLGAKVTLGIPPAASIGIAGLSNPVDPERFDELVAKHNDNPIIVGALKALKHIVGVQSKVSIKGMKADHAEISVGLPPSVPLMFTKQK